MKTNAIFVSTVLIILLACLGMPAAAQESSAEPTPDYTVFTLGEMYVVGEKPPAAENVAIKAEITAEDIEIISSRGIRCE